LFEEGLHGVVEAAEVGVWGAGHCKVVVGRECGVVVEAINTYCGGSRGI
jgi:hypothetical protein